MYFFSAFVRENTFDRTGNPVYRHYAEASVIVYPRTRLMCLLESAKHMRPVCILPSISFFAGLRGPEIHSPRQGYSRIGIAVAETEVRIGADERTDIFLRINNILRRTSRCHKQHKSGGKKDFPHSDILLQEIPPQHEGALHQSSFLEVNNEFGIESMAAIQGFKMQMRACAASAGAAGRYYIPGLYHISGIHLTLGKVSICRFYAVCMSYNDDVAVAAAICGQTHHPAESSRNRSALGDRNIHAIVKTTEAASIRGIHHFAVREAVIAIQTYKCSFGNAVLRHAVTVELNARPISIYYIGRSFQGNEIDRTGRFYFRRVYLNAILSNEERKTYK